jgi:hypothetical protein
MLLAISALFMSCEHKQTETSPLVAQLEAVSQKQMENYKAILFVPSSGCGGCINGAENYLLNNYLSQGRKGIFFVITGHSSEKTVRMRLGEIALRHPDVYCDLHEQYSRPPFMMQYPKVLFLERGVITDEVNVNPDTSEEVYKKLSAL